MTFAVPDYLFSNQSSSNRIRFTTYMRADQHIGTCAVITNHDGLILMGMRKNGFKAGSYGLPGGRVELGEPLVNTVRREVLEETGLVLSNLYYVGVIRENQDEFDFIHFVYAANSVSQQPQLLEPHKCEGWEWIDTKKFHQKILPGHLAAIELFKKKAHFVDLAESIR